MGQGSGRRRRRRRERQPQQQQGAAAVMDAAAQAPPAPTAAARRARGHAAPLLLRFVALAALGLAGRAGALVVEHPCCANHLHVCVYMCCGVMDGGVIDSIPRPPSDHDADD